MSSQVKINLSAVWDGTGVAKGKTAMEGLSASARRTAKDVGKVAPRDLASEFTQVGEHGEEAMNAVALASNVAQGNISGAVGAVLQMVNGLKMLSAIKLGVIGAALSLLVIVIQKIREHIKEAREEVRKLDEMRVDNLVKGVEEAVKTYDKAVARVVKWHDWSVKLIEVWKGLGDASDNLKMSQLELDKQRELGNAKTIEEIDEINRRYEKQKVEMEALIAKEKLHREEVALTAKEEANAAQQLAALRREQGLKSRQGDIAVSHNELIAQYDEVKDNEEDLESWRKKVGQLEEEYKKLGEQITQTQGERTDLSNEAKSLETERQILEQKRQQVDMDKEASLLRLENAENERRLRSAVEDTTKSQQEQTDAVEETADARGLVRDPSFGKGSNADFTDRWARENIPIEWGQNQLKNLKTTDKELQDVIDRAEKFQWKDFAGLDADGTMEDIKRKRERKDRDKLTREQRSELFQQKRSERKFDDIDAKINRGEYVSERDRNFHKLWKERQLALKEKERREKEAQKNKEQREIKMLTALESIDKGIKETLHTKG